MSKVNTTYDNTLKEKIFIIKGEEGYARSTDCVLTELYTNDGERRTDWDASLDNMKLEFRINVLRDVGASQVVLYDNDTTIGVYDFDTNAHSIDLKYESATVDNRIELSYDVEHHLYAKYMGNKQCMKSQSQSYHLFEPIPDAFKCELSFIDANNHVMNGGTNSDYDMGDTIEFKVKLEAEDYISGNTIEVYDGNTLIGEYTTDANGLTELIQIETYDSETYTDFKGLKKLTAKFNKTQYLEAKLTTTNVSVGYTVSVIEYPQYVVNSEPSQVIAKVESYNGNEPKDNMSSNYYAVFQIHRDEDPTGYEKISSSQEPSYDGKLYFDNVVFTKGEFCIRFAFPYDFDYVSEDYTTTIYDNVTVSLGANPTITSLNRGVTLTGKVNGVSEPVKVNVSGIGNLTTDNSGNFTTTYIGSCAGDVTITASVYEALNIVAIEDVYQYWKAPNSSMNMDYQIQNGRLSAISNGWKLETYSDNEPCTITLTNPLDAGLTYSVEYDIVFVDSNDKINYMTLDGITFVEISLKANDHIKMIYDCDNSTVKYYKNNTLITTSSLNSNTVKIMYTTDSDPYHYQPNVGRMTINNLKFKRLNQ